MTRLKKEILHEIDGDCQVLSTWEISDYLFIRLQSLTFGSCLSEDLLKSLKNCCSDQVAIHMFFFRAVTNIKYYCDKQNKDNNKSVTF